MTLNRTAMFGYESGILFIDMKTHLAQKRT